MSGRAVWQMNEEDQRKTRLYKLMQKLGFNDYDRFYHNGCVIETILMGRKMRYE